MPRRAKACPHCKQRIYVRNHRLLTDDQHAKEIRAHREETLATFRRNTRQNLKSMLEAKVKYIEILGVHDTGSCDMCSRLNGKKLRIATLKDSDLPPHDCTCDPWCRCCIAAVID
jgi:hypothetical protein